MTRQRIQLGRNRGLVPTTKVVEVPEIADVEPPQAAVAVFKPDYTIPEASLPKLLWQSYVRGASWADGDYPAWDDKTYYEDTPHGQGMLADFIQMVDDLKPKNAPAGRTMCALGRPFRQHAKPCHPECDFRPEETR